MKGKIFNAQEVQAIIAGNKTMFREVIKPQPNYQVNVDVRCGNEIIIASVDHPKEVFCLRKPLYQVGQKIFCKESFADFRSNNSDIFYKSDFEINNLAKIAELKWSPAQHMKQEHARLTLQITKIRVERLQDISEEDAEREGFKPTYNQDWPCGELFKDERAKEKFIGNWNATHKKPEEKFEVNPWVFVYEFKIIK
jgi:hypothetical protein